MTRAIEFRAWDEAEQKYHYLKPNVTYARYSEWIIEQFTGLLDKNGTKYFDCDIMLYEGTRYLIEWSESYGQWKATSETIHPSNNGTQMAYKTLSWNFWQFGECIGNIHEGGSDVQP